MNKKGADQSRRLVCFFVVSIPRGFLALLNNHGKFFKLMAKKIFKTLSAIFLFVRMQTYLQGTLYNNQFLFGPDRFQLDIPWAILIPQDSMIPRDIDLLSRCVHQGMDKWHCRQRRRLGLDLVDRLHSDTSGRRCMVRYKLWRPLESSTFLRHNHYIAYTEIQCSSPFIKQLFIIQIKSQHCDVLVFFTLQFFKGIIGKLVFW